MAALAISLISKPLIVNAPFRRVEQDGFRLGKVSHHQLCLVPLFQLR